MDKLELGNDIIIERAHRARKSKYCKKDQPRTIVCKILSYKIFVKPRCSTEKSLWTEVKQLREEEDKIAYPQYRSIVVKDKNNVR